MTTLEKSAGISDSRFSRFDDELIDRYFNNEGKDAIKAYCNQVSEERVREALEYIRKNPDDYEKFMTKKEIAEGLARASLNKPQEKE